MPFSSRPIYSPLPYCIGLSACHGHTASYLHFGSMSDLKRPPPSGLRQFLLSVFSHIFHFPAIVVKSLGTFIYTGFLVLTMRRTIRRRTDTKTQTTTSDKQISTTHVEAVCPICQEPIGVRNAEGITERWSMLPCGHHFGSFCIKHYLAIAADEQPPCPICRSPAFHDECGHPVLPTVLESHDTHRDLVKTNSRNSDPLKGDDSSLPSLCNYCQMHMDGGVQLANLDLLELPKWKKPFVSLWRSMPFNKEKRQVETSSVREKILRNRRRRENPQNWEGPYIDVRERDPEWERWWKNQAPRGA
ncbi:hypothetical protein VTI74DRAFT_8890 [Chaetomium olivicolor]